MEDSRNGNKVVLPGDDKAAGKTKTKKFWTSERKQKVRSVAIYVADKCIIGLVAFGGMILGAACLAKSEEVSTSE